MKGNTDGMTLSLHEFHAALNATFAEVNGFEVVSRYGDVLSEHTALTQSAGVFDLSFRSRLCVLGVDRSRWLNGQVSNNVKDLKTGSGCYAALVSGKGKIQSDLNIHILADEILLDFEPGMTDAVTKRLEAYIIADDVQIMDAAGAYGLLSVQGPKAGEVLPRLGLEFQPPEKPYDLVSIKNETLGELYVINQPRIGTQGYDLFVPIGSLGAVMDKLIAACREIGGRACGWDAFEVARIEAAIPRFGVDMDESNLVPETGLETCAISYAKGCYIGQEIIARIRTYGQVAKHLRGLMLEDGLESLPAKGTKLLKDGVEVGHLTSAAASPLLKKNVALGYIRKESNQPGNTLQWLGMNGAVHHASVVGTPF